MIDEEIKKRATKINAHLEMILSAETTVEKAEKVVRQLRDVALAELNISDDELNRFLEAQRILRMQP